MLRYSTLYKLSSVIFTCQREARYGRMVIASATLPIIKYIMRPLFFIIIMLCFSTVHSQENSPLAPAVATEVANVSALNLLKQAKSIRKSDQQGSILLANEALRISQEKHNYRLSAQSHHFLGKLTTESESIEESMKHLLQASLIYKNINDKQNQIISLVDYVNLFLLEKRYNEMEKIIDELLPIAQQFGDELPIALILTIQGDSYYQRKRYDDAIVQYTRALKYLSYYDKSIQKQLAETYKKIAQSYKHLKMREKTAYFYKKSLDIYTILQDQKLMARTLNALARIEHAMGNYVIALGHSTRSLQIYKQINEPREHVKALMVVGRIYQQIGRYEQSLKHTHAAYLYYKKVNNISGMAKTSNQIGLIYSKLKQFDQARSFYQTTIDLPVNKVEAKTIASALREMAVIDLDAGHYGLAKVMAKKALKIYQHQQDKSKQALLTRIIADIYHAQKNEIQAIVYYKESLSFAIEIGSKVQQIKAQTPLADILSGKDIDEAIRLLKESLALSTQINDKYQMLYASRVLHKVEKSRGNIAESLHYAEQEIMLIHIIHNEKDESELVREKAKLYSQKMEIELASLREKTKLDQFELVKKNNEIRIAGQESRISELEITKNRYTNITLVSLLVMCLFIVLFFYRRFVDSRNRNKELDYLVSRDPLTSCYNRRILFEVMNRDFLDLNVLGEYCLIMADIDHFKDVNDTHGHSTGDTVLRGVANILQSGIRQNDITVRFGGEEFCIILRGADQYQAMRIAETMRQQVEISHFDDIKVTCSFGVTSIKFNVKTPTELIDQADLALYKSKNGGRNQVTLWDKTL